MVGPQQFKAFFDHSVRHSIFSLADYDKELRKWFPHEQDRKAYERWCMKRFDDQQKAGSKPISRQELINMVDEGNFATRSDADKLINGMVRDVRPWLPLGYDASGTYYRLATNPYTLRPQRTKLPLTDREILPLCFLGVNTTIQPREPAHPLNRRKANLSEESTRSAESDDVSSPGFEFHQLGELEFYPDSEEFPGTEKEAAEGYWAPTGYSVVARIASNGHIHGLYVIYNMFPNVDDQSCRSTTKWGAMPPSNQEFTCARIGDKLGGMGWNKQIQWKEMVTIPVELVRVVRMGFGRLMRATVA